MINRFSFLWLYLDEFIGRISDPETDEITDEIWEIVGALNQNPDIWV